ncbi:hypothetical protein BU15DRAFT_65174 [Melanogaster broomeanus]|nr:hypothetical protein BU15DRAFT_65174 [Melanogaster broomeanus]
MNGWSHKQVGGAKNEWPGVGLMAMCRSRERKGVVLITISALILKIKWPLTASQAPASLVTPKPHVTPETLNVAPRNAKVVTQSCREVSRELLREVEGEGESVVLLAALRHGVLGAIEPNMAIPPPHIPQLGNGYQ